MVHSLSKCCGGLAHAFHSLFAVIIGCVGGRLRTIWCLQRREQIHRNFALYCVSYGLLIECQWWPQLQGDSFIGQMDASLCLVLCVSVVILPIALIHWSYF